MGKLANAKLLRQRVDESGLTVEQFAEFVLLRDKRTAFRWLSGESPVPLTVLNWLTAPWKNPFPGLRARKVS